MAISQRDRRVLTLGGAAVGAILLVAYVILPLAELAGGIEAELQQKERVLAQRIRAIRSENHLRAELQKIDEQFRRLESQLLESSEVPLAQNELETIVRALAEQCGLAITRSTPLQEEVLGDRYAKVSLQLNLSGGMSELAAFLDALSSHPKFLAVDEFFMTTFRTRGELQLQPRVKVSGYIRLAS